MGVETQRESPGDSPGPTRSMRTHLLQRGTGQAGAVQNFFKERFGQSIPKEPMQVERADWGEVA